MKYRSKHYVVKSKKLADTTLSSFATCFDVLRKIKKKKEWIYHRSKKPE